MTLDEFIHSNEHLPYFMRDFHDAKRVFKIIGEMVDRRKQKDDDHITQHLPDWISAQCYVIDFFLWFMARRGYTLQKSRKKIDFYDIQADFNKLDAEEWEALKKIIKPDVKP